MIMQGIRFFSAWGRILLLALVSVFFLIGTGQMTSAIAQQAEIRLMVCSHTKTGEEYTQYIEEFKRIRPDIKVNLELTTWSGYQEKILTQIAGRIGPDIFEAGSEWTPDMATVGACYILDKYVKEWELWEDFYEVAKEDATWKGHIYAVPLSMLGLRGILYRKDFFEEVGLDPGSPPDTWQDVIEFAVKFTKRDARGNLVRAGWNGSSNVTRPKRFVLALLQAGGTLFTTDELERDTEAALNSPAGVKALQFMNALYNEYKVGLPGGTPVEAGIPAFGTGTAAMGLDYLTDYTAVQRYRPEIAEKIDIAPPLKMLPFTERVNMLYINKYMMASTTKYPDEAWDLIKFLFVPERQAEIWTAVGKPPTTKTADKLWLSKNKDPVFQKHSDYVVYSKIWPRMPGLWGMIYTDLLRAVDETLFRGLDPKEALDKAAADFNKTLEEMKTKYLE